MSSAEPTHHATNHSPSPSWSGGKGGEAVLSILIPVFDYDCTQLVADFLRKGKEEAVPLELILGDDHSERADTLAMLAELNQLPGVRVLRSDERLGRARNRNRMAKAARGEWLLFVDCDAAMPEAFSLKSYIEAGEKASVVCGGLRHPDVNPCPAAMLRYKYEREADQRRAAIFRRQQPYAQLSTFSLLVRRSVFLDIRFDDACTEYGYEDTLFGAELQRRNIPVLHIDNPLLHMGLEPNAVFLRKTETAMRTLRHIEDKMQGHSRLLATAERLRRLHLVLLVRLGWRCTRRLLRANLLSAHPSLFVFHAYKLGYFLCLK